MRLTKDQRFTAYCIMLHSAQHRSKYWDGLCDLAVHVFGIYLVRKWDDVFPEAARKRPIGKSHYDIWFPATKRGWKKRIELLKQCIIETHP